MIQALSIHSISCLHYIHHDIKNYRGILFLEYHAYTSLASSTLSEHVYNTIFPRYLHHNTLCPIVYHRIFSVHHSSYSFIYSNLDTRQLRLNVHNSTVSRYLFLYLSISRPLHIKNVQIHPNYRSKRRGGNSYKRFFSSQYLEKKYQGQRATNYRDLHQYNLRMTEKPRNK